MEQTNENNTNTNETQSAADVFTGDLLTLAEVAKILKVSRKTLYAWKGQGKIRFVKIAGTLIRIPRADMTALITRDDNNDAPPALA